MSVNITDIFGSEIKVGLIPARANRQYSSFAGANGVVAMFMGLSEWRVPVSGVLRVSGANYDAAYVEMVELIQSIQNLQCYGATDYYYRGMTYYNCVMEGFQIILLSNGKQFTYTKEGYMLSAFSVQLVGLG